MNVEASGSEILKIIRVQIMNITHESTIVANKGLLCCDLVDGAVILDSDSGVYYGLNPIGTLVWSLIQKPVALQDLMAPLMSEYDVEPDVCLGDITNLLSEMAGLGLVEIR